MKSFTLSLLFLCSAAMGDEVPLTVTPSSPLVIETSQYRYRVSCQKAPRSRPVMSYCGCHANDPFYRYNIFRASITETGEERYVYLKDAPDSASCEQLRTGLYAERCRLWMNQ